MYVGKSYEPQTKIWLPNTNYDDPMNWLGHKLPCEMSKIVFPEDLNAAIYLPSKLKVREVQLSNEGELILKPDGAIGLTTYGDELACDRKGNFFLLHSSQKFHEIYIVFSCTIQKNKHRTMVKTFKLETTIALHGKCRYTGYGTRAVYIR